MKIVADENIAYVREIFSSLGRVECVSGRSLSKDTLKEADILLVRSITRVDAELLEGTAVRWVGTSTIGTDHIDLDYLRRRGIAFAAAAGANANSVAEYVLAAILVIAERNKINLDGKALGIIGVGNIGSIVEKKAPALGLKILPNDPPLQRKTGDRRFVNLDDALQADIISLHVPLTYEGVDPTYHLLNTGNLNRLRPDTILINTARGPVVDNQALKRYLKSGRIGPTVLDVWENEPDIDLQLLDQVALGTAHVAGYSLDGKVNGVIMLHQAVCRFLNLEHELNNIETLFPAPPVPELELDGTRPHQEILTRAMTGIYDVLNDDRQLRGINRQPPERRAQFFDQLRKNHPLRREAHNTRLILTPAHPLPAEKLAQLGFRLDNH